MLTMTPAEKLAAKEKHHRRPRATTAGKWAGRKRVWKNPKLREVRVLIGLKQASVAKAVGLSYAIYNFVEQGGDVRLTTAARIARFFGRTIEELWGIK